jgi:hypothetical protein
MAKGNDGNLLQHGIELAAVSAIASKPLWLTCTHSMAPRESCPEPNRDRRLRHWLNTQFGTPSVRRKGSSLELESFTTHTSAWDFANYSTPYLTPNLLIERMR